MAAELPEVLADMVARLEEWGFSITAQEASTGFGDRVVVLRKGPLAVRLVADRGQWFIELAPGDCDDWFDPDVWKSCVDGARIPDESSALSAQAEFVVRNLDQLLRAAAGGQRDLLSCLRDNRAGRARRRLGLGE
jgi:hypothetical protein